MMRLIKKLLLNGVLSNRNTIIMAYNTVIIKAALGCDTRSVKFRQPHSNGADSYTDIYSYIESFCRPNSNPKIHLNMSRSRKPTIHSSSCQICCSSHSITPKECEECSSRVQTQTKNLTPILTRGDLKRKPDITFNYISTEKTKS